MKHLIGTPELFADAARSAAAFRGGLAERRVAPAVDLDALRDRFRRAAAGGRHSGRARCCRT